MNNKLKNVIFVTFSPIIGLLVYSLFSVIYSIFFGELESKIPSFIVFLSSNFIVFLLIEKMSSLFGISNKLIFKIAILFYTIITTIGMVTMAYPIHYFVIFLIAIGYFFRSEKKEGLEF